MGTNSTREHLEEAIRLSFESPESTTAYSVGAVLVCHGRIFRGFSRELGPHEHAEEVVFRKAIDDGMALRGGVLYSSMEPCSERASKGQSCTDLILKHGINKVVFALAEPDVFVDCESAVILRSAGVEVEIVESLAEKARISNRHLLGTVKLTGSEQS